MKRFLIFILALMLTPLLCACCIRHDWQAAECLKSALCIKCGETQGEPLGHDWQDGVCTRCGQAEKSSISPPDFEAYGIVPRLALDEQLPFTTATRDDPSKLTTGAAALTDFGIIPADAAHPERPGYEWLYAVIQISFYDDAARTLGVELMCTVEDYYDIQLRGSTEYTDADGMRVYSIMADGELEECRWRRQSQWSTWQYSADGRREIMYSSIWEIHQPIGYDGTVVGIYSSGIDWSYGQYINEVYDDESFLLFRLG